MPTYAYEAVDRKGQSIKNRVTAGSRDDALRRITDVHHPEVEGERRHVDVRREELELRDVDVLVPVAEVHVSHLVADDVAQFLVGRIRGEAEGVAGGEAVEENVVMPGAV